ncbi:MAG: sugar ABC transporter substrate-binding protein, partial [Clostridiales bacterium]|nr:sugar ABC transporter substrate-binding protein [Clostridiales bacterium]
AEDKLKEVFGFIEYMISEEAQASIMDGEYSPEHDAYYPFRVPVRIDLADSLVLQKRPQYLPFLKGFDRPSIDVPVPKWQKIKDELFAPGLSRVMKSETTTEDFLKMIEEEGNKILNGE